MPSGQTSARIAANHGNRHHDGFNEALDKALSQLSQDVGTGHYDVTVQFELEVDVSNPGDVHYYGVTVTAA
jgi:hypothetical protein